jgi:hypothetical protein
MASNEFRREAMIYDCLNFCCILLIFILDKWNAQHKTVSYS